MQQSVNQPNSFDPAITERNFKLSLGDITEGRVLPYMMKEIYKNAPNISVGSYNYRRIDQVHALATNNLDFVVDPVIPDSDEINSYKVFQDYFVVIHREGHPIQKIKNLTVDDLLSQKFINVSNRRKGLHMVDLELEKTGHRRDIALRCQHFLIAPEIIRETDAVIMATHSFAKSNDLPFVEIPQELPPMEYFLSWHKSDEGDGGHEWMKDLIIKAFEDAQK
jgi:DNA-binding transcriptional LysR family regulator